MKGDKTLGNFCAFIDYTLLCLLQVQIEKKEESTKQFQCKNVINAINIYNEVDLPIICA